MYQRIIGVDPSEDGCGMVVLDDGLIIDAFNLKLEQFYSKVTNYLLHNNCIVVIEDIAPYSLRLMPQVIGTCKTIGEVCYRLKNEAGSNVVLIPRSKVKKWAFDTFPDVCMPIIDKKIEKKGFLACDILTKDEIRVYSNGDLWKKRKGSFVYVDDKTVTECMKHLYNIPPPKPGKGYMYGLIKDSWQALAVASVYLHTNHLKS